MMEDEQIRQRALDPHQSFIVQAPAGSGKTELLTQRYLVLLAQACFAPEEIVAITFTRKAALEMQERVFFALQNAQNSHEPHSQHKRIGYRIAKEALRRDTEQGWNLLENPQRLRILTIDALCAELSKRLPILSGQGALACLVEDANPFYEKAIKEWMIHDAPKTLLAHLNNDSQKLMQLCKELLAKREQWLPYLGMSLSANNDLRSRLETGFAQMAQEILEATHRQFKAESLLQLEELLHFAGENLLSAKKIHPLSLWATRSLPLSAHPQELESWRALAQALLNSEGQWRKRIDINLGFPPQCPEKKLFLELLSQWSENELLAAHLRQILLCPPIRYQEDQWQMVSSLVEMLPSLCAHLQVVFQQHRVMDFVELNLSAHRALGDQQEPTDLALTLDYQIRHFLVDEFQDTSVAQFALLEKLVQGWEPGDGRSIFLVGDPQQSIYRFRNAEVGLFIRTAQTGIQQLPIVPLTLKNNFRSGEGLINWFNAVFSKIFPAEADSTDGAVSYSPALATQEQIDFPAVQFSPFLNEVEEATFLVKQIQDIRLAQPNSSIAILVRSRTHLNSILSALQNQQIKFQAVEIESLANRSEIQDLTALACALHHRGDRVSWLAVLRAPYCGLSLIDLHKIAVAAESRTIYEVLLKFESLSELSESAKLRLKRIVPVLEKAVYNQGRVILAEWIETVWQELGGEAALENPQEWLNTRTFFKLLRDNQAELQIFSKSALNKKIEKLRASADPQADANLQIMTIHKAKGLEFDYVFLPQLHRQPAKEKQRLLLWSERAYQQGGSHLLLAPIKAAATLHDPLYEFLRKTEQLKLDHESKRLLYVAATRAKQKLFLTGVLKSPASEKAYPNPGSFMEMLWPFFQKEVSEISSMPLIEKTSIETKPKNSCKRLPVDWRPHLSLKLETQRTEMDVLEKIDDSNLILEEDRNAINIGIVVHEVLADLAENFPNYSAIRSEQYYRRRLMQLGVAETDLEAAFIQIQQAKRNILQDPRGIWILSAEHTERKNEYALNAIIHEQIIRIIVDRTFIDNEGVRWIIDYKTGDPQNLAKYHNQLALYSKILSLKDQRPIRTALYFPLNSLFIDYTKEVTHSSITDESSD